MMMRIFAAQALVHPLDGCGAWGMCNRSCSNPHGDNDDGDGDVDGDDDDDDGNDDDFN